MKKLFVFILVVVFVNVSLYPDEYDIRKLKWGMSFEQVQEIEGLESNFYKSEELLGIKVEVLFGCNNKGLYSVTYSTRERFFAQEARKVMVNKYGEPESDLDYSYLLNVKSVLKKHPNLLLKFLDTGEPPNVEKIENLDFSATDKKILRAALLKRDKWEYGNTVALLFDTVEGSALSYWDKSHHYESKKMFDEFIKDLRKNTKIPEKKKSDSEGEKF